MPEALLGMLWSIRMVKVGAVACVLLLAFANGARAERCIASHYGKGDGLHGSRTATGERFNTHGMTAAHRTRPFGSRVRVTHGGRSVVVRINDRGPIVRGRCIDLSWAAAKAIGIGGLGRVTVETAQ